jgi:hypothetical protein
LLFPGSFRTPVAAQFDQREGSSDGGALLLKAADRHYDFVAGLASCLRDDRQAGKVDVRPATLARHTRRGEISEALTDSEQRGCDETDQYQPAPQVPQEDDWLPRNENLHGRTSEDEERLTIDQYCTGKKQLPFPECRARREYAGARNQKF